MARRDSITALGQLAGAIALVSQGQPGHIVDTLIAERGEKIVNSPIWPVVRPFIYLLLRYRKAIEFADDVSNMPGFQCFEYMSDLLRLDIRVTNAERIPSAGGFLLISNHPTGIADGVAVFDLLKERRPDMMLFANRDAVRVNPHFAEMIIPVEWREEYKSKLKTRETLRLTGHAVEQGKVTVMFPSGRIAYWANGRLNERPWKTSAVALSRKHNLPVLPVHVSARNSGLFYWFAKWSKELRDMTVFHELLNKRGDRFDFSVGHLIRPDELNGDINEVTRALEMHTVHELARDADTRFTQLPPSAGETQKPHVMGGKG